MAAPLHLLLLHLAAALVPGAAAAATVPAGDTSAYQGWGVVRLSGLGAHRVARLSADSRVDTLAFAPSSVGNRSVLCGVGPRWCRVRCGGACGAAPLAGLQPRVRRRWLFSTAS